MELRIQESSIALLPKYIDLYRASFPNATHYQMEYLSWLYQKNPAGPALGADALHGDDVVGQVIALPGFFHLRGKPVKGLVAVNVSVHPDFQGRHLFKRLGLQMCEYGAQHGYTFVMGVANAAATPGWIRQMGFQLVCPLEARIGFGGLGIGEKQQAILAETELRRTWSSEALRWRADNPLNKIRFRSDSVTATAYAGSGKPGISAFAELLELEEQFAPPLNASFLTALKPRVFLGLIPTYRFGPAYVSIPEKFKPSPLNLIYKNLADEKDRINPSTCFINFLDFDAF